MEDENAIEHLIKLHTGRTSEMDSLDAVEVLMALENEVADLKKGERIEAIDKFLQEIQSDSSTMLETMLGDTTEKLKQYYHTLGK